MQSKTAGKHPGYGFLEGAYGRQAWLPLALRAAGSVLSAISHRGKRLDRRRTQLLGWHEKLARRGQPLIGLLPLRMEEFDVYVQPEDRPPRVLTNAPASDPAPSRPSTAPAPTQVTPPAAASPSLIADPGLPPGPPLHRTVFGSTGTGAAASPRREAGNLPEFSKSASRPMERIVQSAAPAAPRTLQRADSPRVAVESSTAGAPEKRLAPAVWKRAMTAAPKPRGDPPFVRPAMRLAVLQPASRAMDSARRNEPAFSAISNFWLIASRANDLMDSQGLRNGKPFAFQQRLVPRVSPSPRGEVHGGFPADQATGVHSGNDIFGESRVMSVREFWAGGANVPHFPASGAGLLSQTHSAWPNHPGTPEIPGVIERLINRTVVPAALPGIEVRGLSPDVPAFSIQPAHAAEEARPAVESAKTPGPSPALPPPLPAAPPPLDINALADKVYQTLVRRQQFEQERRGLY